MNSYPRIESLSETAEPAEDVFVATGEEDDDFQQVDILRVARISRTLARWSGAISETPQRVGENA